MGLSQKFYEMRRLEQIASCFFRHELHYLVGTLKLNRHLPVHKRLALKKSSPSESQPQAIREAFEELGGAFLKLGQVIRYQGQMIDLKPPWPRATVSEAISLACFYKYKILACGFNISPVDVASFILKMRNINAI